MSDFLQQVAKPFSKKFGGEDPRYGDNFFVVKQEIEKLSDVNYAEVCERCREILINESLPTQDEPERASCF